MKIVELLNEAGPSKIDQEKFDQIMSRWASNNNNPTPDMPTPAVTANPTVAPAKKPNAPAVKAAPKPYVPVTNSPFEISIRQAAIGAKLLGAELAAFMGQCAHESAKFTTTKEFADGSQYEGRKDLGNIYPGDGVKYKGRGFIQITGRANYTQAAKDLGIDLVNRPELAEKPDVAIKVSIWYWKNRVRPRINNFNNTKAVTKSVNGGLNGLAAREKYTQHFKAADPAAAKAGKK
jgi:predicted chitinase